MVALVLILTFWVQPALRDASRAIREQREGMERDREQEMQRLRMIEDARKRQAINEALLLQRQEENLKRAEEIARKLREIK